MINDLFMPIRRVFAGWTLLVLVLTNQSWLSRWESRLWLSCGVDDGPCVVVLHAGDALACEILTACAELGCGAGHSDHCAGRGQLRAVRSAGNHLNHSSRKESNHVCRS